MHDSMDASRVARIREDMERAEAKRLQPYYIESFFLEAFHNLGGVADQREARRYEVTHVPALIRNRDRLHRNRRGGSATLRAHCVRERIWLRRRVNHSPLSSARAIRS